MSNSPEQQPKKSPLPIVGEAVLDSLVGEFKDSNDLILETYRRMEDEQPVLTRQMENYILQGGRDDIERSKMMEAMVIAYRLLEAQAEADAMNAAFSEPMPEK